MKIILDAMGGDNAPLAPVMGALQAAKDFGADAILWHPRPCLYLTIFYYIICVVPRNCVFCLDWKNLLCYNIYVKI